MKVYVDELPKSCEECPCCNECMDYGISCNLDDIKLTYDDYANKRHKDCPLQSLADHTKQVRNEAVQEIKEFLENHKCKVFGDYNHQTLQYNETYICEIPEINKFLDQIQGQSKDS